MELGMGEGRLPLQLHAGNCHMASKPRRPVERNEVRCPFATGLRACRNRRSRRIACRVPRNLELRLGHVAHGQLVGWWLVRAHPCAEQTPRQPSGWTRLAPWPLPPVYSATMVSCCTPAAPPPSPGRPAHLSPGHSPGAAWVIHGRSGRFSAGRAAGRR
ncbi:DUF6233 domain-containing protein [Streptomyces sp. NPDC014764]|uniref:DUF6233 domain-containing protein n=1 Tax=Streptomyces sp. NPDC014764 TaxID=3364907 RepID=UPI0036FE9BE3